MARGLADEGVYRNQFETGISNGGLGGDRAEWELGACGVALEWRAGFVLVLDDVPR